MRTKEEIDGNGVSKEQERYESESVKYVTHNAGLLAIYMADKPSNLL